MLQLVLSCGGMIESDAIASIMVQYSPIPTSSSLLCWHEHVLSCCLSPQAVSHSREHRQVESLLSRLQVTPFTLTPMGGST